MPTRPAIVLIGSRSASVSCRTTPADFRCDATRPSSVPTAFGSGFSLRVSASSDRTHSSQAPRVVRSIGVRDSASLS